MQHKLWGLLTLILMVGLGSALAGAYGWWQYQLTPIDPKGSQPVTVVIPEASGASEMAELLVQNQLIRSPLAFGLYIKQHGWDQELKPGLYKFSQGQSLPEIAQTLKEGVLDDYWITIPEGKRREEVATLIANAASQHQAEFRLPDFLQATDDWEGYLFPDTYLIPKTMTGVELAQLMRDTFTARVPPTMASQARTLGVTEDEVVILASLIEREAKHTQDRAMIAGVLMNRLEIGMALQIDATVQYALGGARCANLVGKDCDWWPVITSTDFDSRYNTYQNPGLPPAPIANPGLASIQAMLDPAQHSYLYYLSEEDGTTHYSQTIEEHTQKIEQYLR